MIFFPPGSCGNLMNECLCLVHSNGPTNAGCFDFPGGSDGKSVGLQSGRSRFDLWVGKTLWRRKWQPIPVFLPEKSRWQRSLGALVQRVTKSQTRLNIVHVVMHRHTHFPLAEEWITINLSNCQEAWAQGQALTSACSLEPSLNFAGHQSPGLYNSGREKPGKSSS